MVSPIKKYESSHTVFDVLCISQFWLDDVFIGAQL